MTKAYLDFSLEAACPNCHEEVDCIDQDHEGTLSNYIFNNAWDLAKGYDIICPHCNFEFMLSGIEY